MDLLAICQGLGLALAAGLVIGAVVPSIMPSWGPIAGAAPLGVIVCAAALNGADEPVWPALPVGIGAAGLAAMISHDLTSGAARRESASLDAADAQTPPGVMAIVVLVAVVVAAASLFAPPSSVVVLFGLVWLWLSRRRREDSKHEGLRVLR